MWRGARVVGRGPDALRHVIQADVTILRRTLRFVNHILILFIPTLILLICGLVGGVYDAIPDHRRRRYTGTQ